ncbi:immunoglobulin-like domain-containing protein [Oceanitalea stevensii]|uniref:Ig-like domain repeat protein n=1 Tax=Oceanitalea stevensii TaxID=2763072 RepID=A0ABR8YYL3_9MICO|nr:immunoglobulin-like domain-containing protein [Oceanitalea stevensii]MBD8060883.1 Ig-like domain repeat protein [Oceanitalea stevensii]
MTPDPTATRQRRTRLLGAITAVTVGIGGLAATSASAGTVPPDPTPDLEGLVHHFLLDETSGTVLANSGSAGTPATLVNADKATLTGDGVRLNPDSYETALEGAYVDLPDNLTAGMSNLTIDYDVWVDPANVGHHQIWSLGSKAGSCDADTGVQGSIFASNTAANRPGSRFRVQVGNQALHQERLREGAWKHVTYTQALNEDGTWTGTVYVDGAQQSQVANLTTPPSVNAAGTSCNFLGRSQVSGDYSFRGTLRDFRVYDRAVDADDAAALAAETVTTGAQADAAAIDLGLTEAIVRDITLPKFGTVAGSTITWESSDPSVVEVYTPPASAPKVDVTGRVTRPAVGQPDATATLTATVRKGGEVVTRDIEVTVKAEFQDSPAVERDVYDLDLDAGDDVRGNITLPAEGEFGSTITWESSAPEVVSPTGEVTRPAYGHPDVDVTLTATATKGEASETKTFEVTVKATPRVEEFERYFLGYFKGEHLADGEQIMFATSNGNTALDWTGLTGGQPSLISQLGDQGLRDPHIVRSPEGDTFYMIATDLNWYDQGGYNINDTQYIEVFESNDLVSWTPQRHVKVAPDDAGNAFAPESLWVEEIGAYAVFWAQSLWNDPVNRTGQGNAQMWYNTTRDFQTFSEPQVWQDPAPQSRIDTTAIKVGDEYYRVTKNEAGNAGSDLFSEKHTDFLDSDIDNWELLAPALGRTTWDPNQGYEGPVIFQANPGDTSCPGEFYLWGDRYTNGGGYQAACSEDIEAPTWDPKPITMTNAGVPRPRHGTVIPITLREWNDIRGIENEDVPTTTELTVDAEVQEGETATATATVVAEDGFETGGEVTFRAGSWSETVLLEDGVATATLPADLAPGDVTVTAEFLGFDILEGSEDSAVLVVVPGPDEPEEPTDRRSAEFHLSNTWRGSTDVAFTYGRWTDAVYVGDWDGDGKDTVAVRRGNVFHVSNAQQGGDADVVLTYGRPDDTILVGDWDGDGTDTFAVRRGNTYHVTNSLRGGDADSVFRYGRAADQVLVGDWDGNGSDTFAVRRGATYHVKNSLRGGDADVVFRYGRDGDTTLAGDWDGNGTDTFAVQRGRTYYVNNSLRGGDADTVVTFGRAGDEVHVGDWDGNGTDTLGIRRPAAG